MTRRKAAKNAKSLSVPAELRAEIAEATGTKDSTLAYHLILKVVKALSMPPNFSEEEFLVELKCIIALLRGIKPLDEVEGLLATQMIATYNSAMECLRLAMIPNQTFEGRDMNLKHAEKLLSIFTKQLETLNRNRGKGQQKVTVEHVQVQSGGQAIVGHVEHRSK